MKESKMPQNNKLEYGYIIEYYSTVERSNNAHEKKKERKKSILHFGSKLQVICNVIQLIIGNIFIKNFSIEFWNSFKFFKNILWNKQCVY